MKDPKTGEELEPLQFTPAQLAHIKSQCLWLVSKAQNLGIPFVMAFGIVGGPDLSASGGLNFGVNADLLKKTVDAHFEALKDPAQTAKMCAEGKRVFTPPPRRDQN